MASVIAENMIGSFSLCTVTVSYAVNRCRWLARPSDRGASLAQQLENRAMAVPLGPRHRPCPLRGVRFHRIGAALEKQPHQLRALPPAGPAERRALEQVITHVETGAGIEQHRRERDGHLGRYSIGRPGNAMEDR